MSETDQNPLGDVERLRGEFAKVEAASEEFARRFYAHLFEIGPDLESYFDGVEMNSQGAMVLQAVRIALGGLENIEDVRPTLESLGYRHVNYGVKPEQYAIAIDAFIEALRETLGDAFNPDAERLWREVLSAVTSMMVMGAETRKDHLASNGETKFAVNAPELATDDYFARFMPTGVGNQLELYADDYAENLPKNISVEYAGEKTADAAPLQTILEISHRNDIAHVCVCGGLGKCSTCRVVVLDGLKNCLPRNQVETSMAQKKGFSPEVRLACQTRLVGPVKLKRLVYDEEDINQAAEIGREYVGQEMPLAVMFADIRGFTPFAEGNLAYDIVHALNRYFNAIGEAIDSHDGYIDKYIGDGLMALFGLKTERDTHPCVDAVSAAIAMMDQMDAVNRYLTNHLDHAFRIVVGIHYGTVIVGEIGFRERRLFTAIGDVVNIAARLECEAKNQNVSILVSDAVRRELPRNTFSFGQAFELALKGKKKQQAAHEIIVR